MRKKYTLNQTKFNENALNPFTKFLRRGRRNDSFDRFVAHWDRLEWLTIRVYKGEIDAADVRVEFARVWHWLRQNYGHWQEELEPCWQRTRVAGTPTKTVPFLLLLAIESPGKIVSDWRPMQHLPAAREALNQYLLKPK